MAHRTQPIRRTGRRRTAAAVVGVLAALLPILSSEPEALAQAPERPNVVVIMTDDQDLASLAVMDNVRRHIARRGVTFENAFATFPLCCPSRASFLTGQYAHNHGVTDNSPPKGGFQAFDDRATLPVSLRRDGYRTGWVGKYMNGYDKSRVRTARERRDFPPGWSEWRAMLTGHYLGWEMNDNGTLRRFGKRPADYQTDVFTREAVGFIRRGSRRDRPFFLTLSYKAPHIEQGNRLGKVPNPRPAARHAGRFKGIALPRGAAFNERDVSDKPAFVRRQPRLDRGERRRLTRLNRDRRETLLAADEGVGRVVEVLRRAGELRNSLLVFWSDNGFLLGEHRLRGKSTLYEESVRVPLVMRGPGVPAGRSRDQIVGNIDLAPTILGATDADPLRPMDGRSLMRLARRPNLAANRDILLENRSAEAVRTQRYMYAEHPGGEVELYDLREDPNQLTSRHDAPEFQQVRGRLAERLEQLRDCAGQGCR